MPDEKTHADSIRLYLTGATSDGGAQADPDAALGDFKSSSEVNHFSVSIVNPISNITVDFVGGSNGEGSGSMEATGDDTLRWTPPGGSAGADVTILNGETKILEGGGGATEKYIRVSRTSATNLTGTATVTLTTDFNNVVGFDNVSSGEASAGDTEYRALMMKNEATSEVKNVKVFVGQIGTQRVSGAAQLAASGADTISVSAGNFDDWPNSGFCRIETSGGSLKEIVYYSSRTSTSLTVPSTGRGLLGTSAQAGAATDLIYSVPGIRIGKEAPSSQPSGDIQVVANEDTAPTSISWSTAITASAGVDVGNLAASNIQGIWIERVIPASAVAEASVLNVLSWQFDAA